MNKYFYKNATTITGVLIIINVIVGLKFDYKWSDYINGVLAVVLILTGSNYFSQKNTTHSNAVSNKEE